MIEEIFRNFLEIESLNDLNEVQKPSKKYTLNVIKPKNFQLNKFLYKQVGKKCHWVDRLVWTDQNWMAYISKENVLTYILKHEDDLVGYFELVFHEKKLEIEIAYFGILEEYFGKKLGGFLLSEAIKESFILGATRVWVHTCSLDHQNALKNYLSRGMKIYNTETISVRSA